MESHSLYFTRIFYLILLGLSNNIKITPLKITPSMGLFFFFQAGLKSVLSHELKMYFSDFPRAEK